MDMKKKADALRLERLRELQAEEEERLAYLMSENNNNSPENGANAKLVRRKVVKKIWR